MRVERLWTAALGRLWRWRLAATVGGVGALAAVLRFTGLGYPKALVFDETYYAKGAHSLLHQGYEGSWKKGMDDAFVAGDFSHLGTTTEYVVHPPLGKWMIAGGMELFGSTPFGWRFSAALVGTLTVMMLVLVGRLLFGSLLWGGLAGLFLAIDGQHIVMSRTALLDIFLTFFVLLGSWLLLLDRRRVRARLERGAAAERARLGLGVDEGLPGWGARVGVRWWRLAAIAAFGLGTGVKWSGVYFAAGLLVVSVVWDAADRRAVGARGWAVGSLVRAAVPGVVAAAALLPAVYVATWAPWFASDQSYMRHWAEDHPGEGVQWLPESMRSLAEYHGKMYAFHTDLTPENGYSHAYAAHPAGWPLQVRATSFYWERVDEAEPGVCGHEYCVSAITAIGNPVLWWAGTAALLFALWRVVRRFDLVALGVVSGTLAGWLPWFLNQDRIIFLFYTVSFAPWMMLTLVYALRRIAQPGGRWDAWSHKGVVTVGAFVSIALLAAAYFWPLWSGQWIPYPYWFKHMWLNPQWI